MTRRICGRDVGVRVQKQLGNLVVAMYGSDVERRATVVVSDVDASAG